MYRRRSTAKARGETDKLVKRYDPVTGKRVYVAKDSDEADSYPTRKPKVKSKFAALQNTLLSPLGGEVARAALPALKSPGKTIVKVANALKAHAGGIAAGAAAARSTLVGAGSKVAGAVASRLGAASAVAGTSVGAGAAAIGGVAVGGFLAGYYGTKAVLDRIHAAKDKKAQLAFEAAQAYRLARLDAAKKLGRELTRSEQMQLGQVFKQKLAQIGYTP